MQRSRRRSFCIARIDELGGPESYNHYAVGWAHAMDTPYQWTKQVASHWGGTRNGTIVHWPQGHQGQGRDARSSSTTSSTSRRPILEAAGLPEPIIGQRRRSRSPSKASACSTRSTTRRRAERHETQYFEMFGNRGIYHKGWTAVTRHSTPWV